MKKWKRQILQALKHYINAFLKSQTPISDCLNRFGLHVQFLCSQLVEIDSLVGLPGRGSEYDD